MAQTHYISKMTATQSLKIYELLNAQFQQPEKAHALTEAIEAVVEEKILEGNRKFETLLNKDIEILRSDINARLTDVESKLRVEVRAQKSRHN